MEQAMTNETRGALVVLPARDNKSNRERLEEMLDSASVGVNVQREIEAVIKINGRLEKRNKALDAMVEAQREEIRALTSDLKVAEGNVACLQETAAKAMEKVREDQLSEGVRAVYRKMLVVAGVVLGAMVTTNIMSWLMSGV